MLREKLVDKKHLEEIRNKAFELQERIKNGEIDAEKTAEKFYRDWLEARIAWEVLSVFSFIFGGINLLGIANAPSSFWIFFLSVVGCILIFFAVFIFINVPPYLTRFTSLNEARIIFKNGEKKGTKGIE